MRLRVDPRAQRRQRRDRPAVPGRATSRNRFPRFRQYLELANQEISHRLLLGGSTVKPHIGAILRKLGLRDRMQIVVYSCENGIGR